VGGDGWVVVAWSFHGCTLFVSVRSQDVSPGSQPCCSPGKRPNIAVSVGPGLKNTARKTGEETNQMKPIIRIRQQGRTVSLVGDVYRFLATGEDTNCKYALIEALVGPGGGPPPHVHSQEEEGFYILEGEITFTINGERVVATAGMFANMPVGTLHSFKNESNKPAKMLVSVAPAGLEKMFMEIGVPLAEGATTALPTTREEIEKLLAIAPKYGIEIRLPH
jgi:mannose-6-phosphate isomerase-like protein (cupin superfamily)